VYHKFFKKGGASADYLKTSAHVLLNQRLRLCQPISSILSQDDNARLNLVIDSIGENNLFEIITALVIVSALANNLDITLRIITRGTPLNPNVYTKWMRSLQEKPAKKIQFYSDYDRDCFGEKQYKLEINAKDIFIATSWQSAKAITRTSLKKKFFYIIQEDESLLCCNGDDVLMCRQMMNSGNITYIVNSKPLYKHFLKTAPNIVKNGIYFEPILSKHLHTSNFPQRSKNKYNLLVCSQSSKKQDLFLLGIKFIEDCLNKHIIDTKKWDIYFVGKNIPKFHFSNGYTPKIYTDVIDIKEYVKFLQSIDLAFSFVYAPQLDYLPFYVASLGGVVLTNKCFNKKDLADYSNNNIIISDLKEIESKLAAKKSINLSMDLKKRNENYQNSKFFSSWESNLVSVIDFMINALNITK